MDELKNMTDYELALRIQGYREQLDQLMKEVSRFLRGEKLCRDSILNEYKRLKNEVKADAHYVGLVVNEKGVAKHYNEISSVLREAAAYGFIAPTNSSINQNLFNSIEEAHYKLGKCNIQGILDGNTTE